VCGEEDQREEKAPSIEAGEFVREEFEHFRGSKHGKGQADAAADFLIVDRIVSIKISVDSGLVM
jgi:hypothetical protein